MKTKIPSLINLLILSLVTAFTWIGFSVQRALTQEPEQVVSEVVSKELNPTLDMTTMEKIKNRIFLSEGEIPQTIITSSPTPTPTSVPTPTPQPSETPTTEGTPSPTPVSTEEGGAGL